MNKTEQNTSVLFVDFYNTLTADSYWGEYEADIENQVEKYFYTDNQKAFNGWMRGDYTDKEVMEMLAKELNESFETMWSGFIAGCEAVSIDNDIASILRKLSNDLRLVLATDNFACFDDVVAPNNEIMEVFDYIYNSYNHGNLKIDNEGKIFRDIANDIDGNLNSAYLIEDQQAICEVFENLGGSPIHVEDVKQTAGKLEKLHERI